jgi:hypothetical protein
MVDFNSETMLGTNRSHILDLIILGRRDEWINTFQRYQVSRFDGRSNFRELFNSLKAILMTLSLELKETLVRKWSSSEFDSFFISVRESSDDSSLLVAFNRINEVLDSLNLIRIDTKRQIDTTNIELENETKGI